MSNRTVLWMTIFVVICIAFLLILNSIPMIWTPQTEKYLKYNDVRGMAIQYKNKLYTLNFDQQNEMIGYLNQSIPIENKNKSKTNRPLDVSKIVIYRFGLPDLTILPIEYRDHNLIFSSEWNPGGLMSDVSAGALENLVSEAHD